MHFIYGKYEGTRSFLRTRRRLKDNIKVDFTGEREADCFDLGHEAPVSAKDWVHFIDACMIISLLNSVLFHVVSFQRIRH
jgi:hypothetical protein